jgi:hypothetical protein
MQKFLLRRKIDKKVLRRRSSFILLRFSFVLGLAKQYTYDLGGKIVAAENICRKESKNSRGKQKHYTKYVANSNHRTQNDPLS